VETLLFALAVLACPVGMGAMMWFMMRGHGSANAGESPAQAEELAALRSEITALRAQQERDADRVSR
jgi:flagellar basal body-associated protein FliL